MIFNSKQLEELDNVNDGSSNIFESPGDESSGSNDSNETALAWRRTVLEEALANVKRSAARPVDPAMTYEIGSLLFDGEQRNYGRVRRSIPGFLDVSYLVGGEREYGKLNVKAYLKEFGETKSVTELARSLDVQEGEILTHLAALGLQANLSADEASNAKGTGANEEIKLEIADDLLDAVADSDNVTPKAKKSKAKKKAASKKKAVAKAEKEEKTSATDRRKKRAKQIADMPIPSKPANPIDDPNTFIRQNFDAMSNRELARSTGLSEHTIRRKLGEWKLKRTKKKAAKK